jgi:hypothetical protein
LLDDCVCPDCEACEDEGCALCDEDIAAVEAAVSAIEGLTFFAAYPNTIINYGYAKDRVEYIINAALELDDEIELLVNLVEFTAPEPGTNGSFKFTVTVTLNDAVTTTVHTVTTIPVSCVTPTAIASFAKN